MKTQAIILIATTSLILSSCQSQKIERLPTAVNVQIVAPYSPDGQSHYSAVIKPKVEVELAFKTGGYVDRLLQVHGRTVQAGDFVRKGTILARVRAQEFAMRVNQQKASLDEVAKTQTRLEASLNESKIALDQSRTDFERTQRLFNDQSATKPDLESAKARYEMNQERVHEAEAQLAANAAGKARVSAALGEAQVSLADTILYAPFDGVIIRRNVEIDSLVNNGTVGFVIADTSSVKVSFGVPDVELINLKLGQLATITTETAPTEVFHGRITDIAPEADPRSRVFNVEVTLPNWGQKLRSGMVASLTTTKKETGKSLPAISLNSIVRSSTVPEGYAVFVVKDEGGKTVSEERQVKVGDAFGQMIVVLDGLKSGEKVITNGSTRLVAGQEIRVVE